MTPPLLPMNEMVPTQYFGANIPAKIRYGFEAVIERAEFEQAKRNKLNQKIMLLERLFERQVNAQQEGADAKIKEVAQEAKIGANRNTSAIKEVDTRMQEY